jgi:hypothetical protein
MTLTFTLRVVETTNGYRATLWARDEKGRSVPFLGEGNSYWAAIQKANDSIRDTTRRHRRGRISDRVKMARRLMMTIALTVTRSQIGVQTNQDAAGRAYTIPLDSGCGV